MRTDVDIVDESAQVQETDNVQEGREPTPPLRLPAVVPQLTDEQRREIRRKHLAFKLSGRTPGMALGSAREFVPLSLFSYLDFAGLRADYPICLFDARAQGPMTLTQTFEQALDAVEFEGDDMERCRRWALQLEQGIRRASLAGSGGRLFHLWNATQEELSVNHQDDPDKLQRFGESLAAVRGRIPGDAELIGCDQTTAPALLEALEHMAAETDGSNTAQVLRDVVRRLEDLLALEEEESDAGRTPDHLKESVGQAFEEALDFEAFSNLLHDAPHGDSLPKNRRTRIEAILKTLRGHLRAVEEGRNALRSFESARDLVKHIQGQAAEAGAVSRAWLTARLEVDGRFDEERHAALMEVPDSGGWDQSWTPPTPFPPVHLDFRNGYSGDDVALLSELYDRQIPARILITLGEAAGADPNGGSMVYLPVSLGERLIPSARASGFLCQRALVDVSDLIESMDRFLSADGTAVMIVYDGVSDTTPKLHPFLKSATALEARLTPAFLMDADRGDGWRTRFVITGNEQPDRIWPTSDIDVVGDGDAESQVTLAFTPAAFMLCHTWFEDHFAVVAPSEWHDDQVPVEEYDGASDEAPFVLAAAEDGAVNRVLLTDYVWKLMVRVAEGWRLLRELGGVANSFAEQAVANAQEQLEAEHRERLEELESEHRTRLETTTGKLAQQIVANIAAGLLDGTTSSAPAIQTSVPSPSPAPSKEPEPASPDDEEAAQEEVVDEEEDLEVFDEPYIETPRCTTCDECTTINPRMFAYNENKQAYIADASAGTFRELVLAAEKCPVRIIHPGKPLNPDEPHLDELRQRAEPFL